MNDAIAMSKLRFRHPEALEGQIGEFEYQMSRKSVNPSTGSGRQTRGTCKR